MPLSIAKCCPSIARDTQTDVSCTSGGVWYAISRLETKFGGWGRGGRGRRPSAQVMPRSQSQSHHGPVKSAPCAASGPRDASRRDPSRAGERHTTSRLRDSFNRGEGERTATLRLALDDVLRDRDQGNRRLAVGHDRIDGLLVQPFRLGPRAVEPHELRVGRLVRV